MSLLSKLNQARKAASQDADRIMASKKYIGAKAVVDSVLDKASTVTAISAQVVMTPGYVVGKEVAHYAGPAFTKAGQYLDNASARYEQKQLILNQNNK